MIARLRGRVLEVRADSVLIEAGALAYEVLCPPSVLAGLEPEHETILETVHFLQIDQNRATPVLIGFAREEERAFWEILIGVLGPKSATKAMAAPIEHIARWVETGDVTALKGLPGIGPTKARELVAKLQGKMGRFVGSSEGHVPAGRGPAAPFLVAASGPASAAIEALLDLDYKRAEASDLVARALRTRPDAATVEQILEEVFRR